MHTRTTPVLIVGAGLGGLSTALFLGLHGVPALVAERHPGTSLEPKARGQMPAAMEALRAAGLERALLDAAPPGRPGMTIVIAESVTGRVFHSVTEAMPDFGRYSPAPTGLVGQERAEPLLAARAAELGADIRFSTRLESFTDGPDGVTAVLRDLATGEVYEVEAAYLVGADGHRGGIREAAGIGGHGRGVIGESTSLLFEADLDLALDGAAVQMHYLQNPALPGGSGAFVSTDTPGRFVAAVEAPRDDEHARELIRLVTGLPELEVKLLGATAWSTACRVADRFSSGRVHLVGDAAHVMPPTGGQGGNSALMDGHHLAWKLAAVVRGQAGPGLLDSHDAERRPFAECLVEQQYANMVHRMAPHLADDTVAERLDPARLLFGYRCPAGAFAPETTSPSDDALDDVLDDALFEDPATPSGRPGTRAPHVPLGDGSTRDLYGRGFVLLTDDPGWRSGAERAAGRLGVPVTVPALDGDWAAAHGVTPSGAVLVRPDGLIAWRGRAQGDPEEVERALRVVLDR
ncbi:FAD-dependent monooxygenase [Streptomyces sp. UNOB3_S3]|uniref:FAD-dependent monooxygenase n=1 Tax=Streptomyces sp. UNOB3_S3 TaxID=2871682 RepID=UPI001E2D0957|nr:FAD-dependent monooxygenase [Streptomyces sp. UNOB3_S3]MCC3776549.1 FAD-dependent monooxygenase [Streptomyces sp. UNOB3_S3]